MPYPLDGEAANYDAVAKSQTSSQAP
jgi:hypothetical protein